jgi:phosphoserine phosphatase RsbU/P
MSKRLDLPSGKTASHLRQRAPWWMFVVAASFIAYFALLVYCDFWGPQPMGVLTEFSGEYKIVRAVFPNSPAERAGLQPSDRVLSVDGRLIRNLFDWTAIRINLEVDRLYRLEIERAGERRDVLLSLQRTSWQDWISTEGMLLRAVRGAQFITLIFALIIAFSRPYDRIARVGAWFLATLATLSFLLPYGMAVTWRQLPLLLGGLLWIPLVSTLAFAPLGFTFFAIFPRQLFRARWAWISVWTPILLTLPLVAPYWYLIVYQPERARGLPEWMAALSIFIVPVYVVAGCIALIVNYRRLESPRERRRVRVLVIGSIAGWVGILALLLYWWGPFSRFAVDFFFTPARILPVVLFLALPLSFAYAVVRHRVMEIPMLLKRSARYLLVQRGSVFLLFLLSIGATLLFVKLYQRLVQPGMEIAVPAGLASGVCFGILLAWVGAQVVKRTTQRIDRAFFRSAYDARQILEDLAEQARTAKSREALAKLLASALDRALHPRTMAVYLETSNGLLSVVSGQVPSWLETIAVTLPELSEVMNYGQPWDVPPAENGGGVVSKLAPLEPECLVPILGRNSRLAGVLVLGPRLSEEPYSSEDKRLLASAASQVGIAMETILLAEEIAERLEAERRALREMEIAMQVQSKLFPQKMPALETLECAGACTQARAVGGDYYDFLDLGPGRLALVLADVAGKGISAALLMANLQANLRSQYARALDDLPSLLRSVNRLFHESTAPERYATLFFGTYEDATRQLRYVNCGHNPPLLLRADGEVEWLEATATVLGMFDTWDCAVGETHLESGDTLIVYSDGVTEARSDQGEEFGQDRLLQAALNLKQLGASSLLETLVPRVQQYCGYEQDDDLTLLVIRTR